MLLTLRGTIFLYQGEELGLPEADVPFEALRDPYGITFWPNFKGRDGSRTPMPWTGGEHGGFTAAEPWLPVPAAHRALSVDAQHADAGSTLNAVRAFLAWRRTQPALTRGSIRFLDTPEPVLAFVREHDGQRLLAAFNLSDAGTDLAMAGVDADAVNLPGFASGSLREGRLRLPAYGVFHGELATVQTAREPASSQSSGALR